MSETAKQKEAREKREAAQAAAKQKAQEEAAEAAKKEQEEKDKEATDSNLAQEKEEPVAKPLISTVHDDVINKKLAHASTPKARQAAAENYRLQQERQKQLETDTQRGLGFDGVRSSGKKDDK